MFLIIRPLRRGGPAEHLLERLAPFVLVERPAYPVEAAVVALLDGHGVRDDFHNPRFGDAAVERLAERDVHVSGAVGMVEDDEGRGFADDERRFEDSGGFFHGIAGVHRAVFRHVVLEQPAEGPLAHLVETAGGGRRYEKDVSHALKDRYLLRVVNRFLGVFSNFIFYHTIIANLSTICRQDVFWVV